MNTTQIAEHLSLSKGRISQLVRDGRLDGCYTGEGRARRFDVAKVKAALNGTLDPGQLLGNGAKTRERLREPADDPGAGSMVAPEPSRSDSALPPRDPDRYELARTQKAEEEAKRLRRINAEAEGTLVLASVVASETARQMAQEVAQIESSVIRTGARRIADELDVDFREARVILTEVWRAYRAGRSAAKTEEADAAQLTADEQAEDF
ncbi:hypothetical protein [Salipiger abyssi]|uniref:Helix-turn-helix domain-containing protein n=1 Tax=Salipiger abyssi TaxID=1250539 RepID=A0A1P8UWG0_9RHOB|nr:hypothetical protein [Salipiger abyssi]APZ53733.1 hypothetical protein Ga0080574_TMP3399 [Salipiger abyssi]